MDLYKISCKIVSNTGKYKEKIFETKMLFAVYKTLTITRNYGKTFTRDLLNTLCTYHFSINTKDNTKHLMNTNFKLAKAINKSH